MEQLFETIEKMDTNTTIGVVLAILVVIVSIISFWLIKKSPTKRKYVLILGTSNSGKSSLFTQLVFKKSLITLTSISQNVGTAIAAKTSNTKEKKFELVDVPGQEKVRKRIFDSYKKTAKALIFVVDSSTFQKDLKDVALYVYEVLTDEQLAKANLKLLIVCNKQDNEFAKGKTLIQTSLEKEIELLRKISTSSLQSTEGKKKTSGLYIRNEDAQFEFSNLKYFKVNFEESNATSCEVVQKTVLEWLQSNVN